MLRVLGMPVTACDRITRRDLLKVGALALGGRLVELASASADEGHSGRVDGKARSVILLDLFGGPSHLDTLDPKPDAPPEIRGEFRPIATSVPGLQVCEHLPRLARLMHRTCLIRTVSHGYNSHSPYAVMTGFTSGSDREDYFAKPTNHPSMGSVCQYLGLGRRRDLPGYVCLPAYPGYSQGLRRAGPYGGYLGSRYDPLFSTCEPSWARKVDGTKDFYDHTLVPAGDPRLPSLEGDLTLQALDRRRSLLEQLEEHAARLDRVRAMSQHQQQAL